MEVLVLDGKDYVKASKAARDLGYATDYVGQLCRSGQIDAHLIGRTWYVNQDELSTHKVEKKRMSRAKAREYAKRTIEEYRQKSTQKEKTSKNIAIQYETDSNDLIPSVRKLSVATEAPKKKKADFGNLELEKGDDLLVEHKGEKIVMQGELDVIDVTDGIVDAGTTILTPKIQRKNHREEPILGQVEAPEEVDQKPNFLSRLAENGISQEIVEEIGDHTDQIDSEELMQTEDAAYQESIPSSVYQRKQEGSIVPYFFTLLLVISMSIATLGITKVLTYDYIKRPSISENFSISYVKTIEIIKLKI